MRFRSRYFSHIKTDGYVTYYVMFRDIMPRDARTELQWTWVVPIPKQSIQHLALRDATRHNSIPRPSRRLSAISTEGETAGDLDSLGEAELTRPGVEGPVEDAMAGEA